MRNVLSALLMSGGIIVGAAMSPGTAQAAAFSSPTGLTSAAEIGDGAVQIAHRRVRPRVGIYFGFGIGPRYWFPGPYYYPYSRYYFDPYYATPRYYRRCWRIKGTRRSVCRWYRRW